MEGDTTLCTAIAMYGPDEDAFRGGMGDVPKYAEDIHSYHSG